MTTSPSWPSEIAPRPVGLEPVKVVSRKFPVDVAGLKDAVSDRQECSPDNTQALMLSFCASSPQQWLCRNSLLLAASSERGLDPDILRVLYTLGWPATFRCASRRPDRIRIRAPKATAIIRPPFARSRLTILLLEPISIFGCGPTT
jgi:hypothetical protein